MQKVYLAGGMRGDWNTRVKALEGFIFFDPKDKEEATMTVNEYAPWDLHYVKQCDICFVYIKNDNPSCIGLAVEAGYAKGLGKTVILVLEPGHEKAKYLLFVTKVADIVYDDLQSGIDYLKSFKQ